MSILALGISHHNAAIDLRERLAFGMDKIAPALSAIQRSLAPKQTFKQNGTQAQPDAEVALLSTCNRTELYWSCPALPNEQSAQALLQWLSQTCKVSETTLKQHAYQWVDHDAARHTFRVASGLDSMVLGEPQILGQMKNALRAATDAGTLGTTLHQMFQRSFTVAKAVRTSTDVGAHSISMAAAAVRLTERLFANWQDTRVLFVGAGEMIELAATHFAAKQPRQMTIANRSEERAQGLQQRFGAGYLPLAQLADELHQYDVVVTCTASSLPIIGLGAVKRALKLRRNKPLLMVDMAVPRDIEPEVKAMDNVFLYTLDDLAKLVQQGRDQRQAAVSQAEVIVDGGVRSFMQWLAQRNSVPLIQQLNTQVDLWRMSELDRAKKMLARGQSVDAVMDALSRGMAQKILHGAYVGLRDPDEDIRQQAEDSVNALFLRGQPERRMH